MNPSIQAALIGVAGSVMVAVVSYIANMQSARIEREKSLQLIDYRLRELEKKVEKHNSVIDRTIVLEGRMREAEHDIRDLKGVKEHD